MQHANKNARAFDTSLGLTPAVLQIAQTIASLSWKPSLTYRAECDITSILRAAAWHRNAAREDEDSDVDSDDEEDFDNGTTPAMIEARGTLFFSDVIWESGNKKLYRLPRTRPFKDTILARLYSSNSIQDLKGIFGVRIATNPIPVSRLKAKFTPVRDITFPIEDLVGRIPTKAYGIQFSVPALREMEGEDRDPDEDDELEIGDNLFREPTTIDKIITIIFRQFYYDILRTVPRGKNVHKPYITLDVEQLGTVTSHTFQQHILPFTTVRIASVVDTVWSNDIYDSFFPYKDASVDGHGAELKLNMKRDQYPHCRYYHLWLQLVNRLNSAQVTAVRTAMLTEFMTLQWLPFASERKIWNTRDLPLRKVDGRIKQLPFDLPGSAPAVAVRKWYAGGPNIKLSRYALYATEK